MEAVLGRGGNYAAILLKSSTAFGSLFSSSTLRCLCLHDPRKWNNVLHETRSQERSFFTYTHLPQFKASNRSRSIQNLSFLNNEQLIRIFSSQTPQDKPKDENDAITPKKQTVFQKMKQLTKDYWHILIPVHVTTSIVWISIFYTAAKNGVDVISLMEYVHMPEQYVDMIRNSDAGNWAVTYALYKVFTPLRYTVTVGGTTMSIRYLDRMGYLKFKRRSTEATPSNVQNSSIKKKAD
ncbi:hypothetical protein PV327_005119 [Microctonus hyperodae]|uniref:DUF1279 domain-containing protein n=1 Tax=Microctonus hyperodae TaxID=165561 RepID=A0AA39G159_MICHY|nr:hypothetical protein PV327_005119 [Microctonus hyperodae]